MTIPSVPDILKTIRTAAGKEDAYIVGGWLRDRLMKRVTRDLDIAVSGNAEKIARLLARRLKGRLVRLDEENRIYRIVLSDNPAVDYIDVAALRGRTIENDLHRRDFTVNALALAIDGGTPDLRRLIDPCGGARDIKRRVIRQVSAATFADDPLRLLRGFRCAAELAFSLTPATRAAIKKHAPLITKSASERVRDELFRILALPASATWIEALEAAGLLPRMIPEILAIKKSARQFYFHPNGLWQHVVETYWSAEKILEKLDTCFPAAAEKLSRHLDEEFSPGVTRRSILKLAALLHDIAKPACATRDGTKMRFLGHEEQGATMAAAILTRLRLSRKEIRLARTLIEHHMRPISLSQAPALTARATFRFFRDLGNDAPDLLILALADWHSYKRLKTHKPALLRRQQAVVTELMARFFAAAEKPALPKLIDGHVLMKSCGLEPGPAVGKILRKIQELQGMGKITTPEQALATAQHELTRLPKRYRISRK
jgi:tRNA nucleotidyltransferase/poly(A) polymerase